jgi:hypothetical protein
VFSYFLSVSTHDAILYLPSYGLRLAFFSFQAVASLLNQRQALLRGAPMGNESGAAAGAAQSAAAGRSAHSHVPARSGAGADARPSGTAPIGAGGKAAAPAAASPAPTTPVRTNPSGRTGKDGLTVKISLGGGGRK